MGKRLQGIDISNAAACLGCEEAAIRAVLDVESRGTGFLPAPDGRVKVLFEGHIFWQQLQNVGINPALHAKNLPGVLYQAWTRAHYRRGAGEWERLNTAALLHKDAALASASWGMFQIMGFNHSLCGFDNVQAFVDAQSLGEKEQLQSFCIFIQKRKLTHSLVARNWQAFAKAYNGPGYAKNQYDIKLADAYATHKAILNVGAQR